MGIDYASFKEVNDRTKVTFRNYNKEEYIETVESVNAKDNTCVLKSEGYGSVTRELAEVVQDVLSSKVCLSNPSSLRRFVTRG